MQLTGAQFVWECLIREGIQTVFGYPGGAILPAYDALRDYPVHHVLTRHEQGAVHMADGLARASGRTGVAMATSGPGAMNMVTGIATAMMDSSPLVCITGQVDSAKVGLDAFQEIDVTGVTLPITKHNYCLTRPEEVAPGLLEAFQIARSGRPGPVLVDITKDALQGSATVDWERDTPRPLPASPASAPALDLEPVRHLIRHSRRPVILAGHGVLLANAAPLLYRLAEENHIPVAMTLLGLGAFPAGHPLSLGLAGLHGLPPANLAIQHADLLLALGTRFDERITGHTARFAPRARKIQIDIDPAELGKNIHVDIAINCGLQHALPALLPALACPRRSSWLRQIQCWQKATGRAAPDTGKDQPLAGNRAVSVLHEETAGNAWIFADVGQNQMWAAQSYPVNLPGRFITTGGLGTMGFALPAAIGASLALPGQEIWVIAGDGGFQMTMPELATLVQEGTKVNILILNNGQLGMIRQLQDYYHEKRYIASAMLAPDFVRLAGAFGLAGRTAGTAEELRKAIREARQSADSMLIDCRIAPADSVFPMVLAGTGLSEMILRPAVAGSTTAGNFEALRTIPPVCQSQATQSIPRSQS